MPRILSFPSEACARKKRKKKWKDVGERERKIKTERWRDGEIYISEAGRVNKTDDNICIFIREARFHALRGMTWALSPQTGKRQKENETMKALCEWKKEIFRRYRLMSRRNFRVKTVKLFRRPLLVSQFYENGIVPVTVFPHLHFAFTYFLFVYFHAVFT